MGCLLTLAQIALALAVVIDSYRRWCWWWERPLFWAALILSLLSFYVEVIQWSVG